jgi:hypothetical protein
MAMKPIIIFFLRGVISNIGKVWKKLATLVSSQFTVPHRGSVNPTPLGSAANNVCYLI